MAILNTRQAAKRLGVSTRRVLALIEAGDLKAIKIGRDWTLDATAVGAFSRRDRRPGPRTGSKRGPRRPKK